MKINSGTFLSYLQLKESKNNSVQRLVEEDPQSDNTQETQATKSKCLVISKDYGFIPEYNAIVYNGKEKQNSIGDIINTVIKLKDDKKDELFSEDKLSVYDKSSVSNIEKFRDASSCVEDGELKFKLVIVNGEITESTSIPSSSSQVPDFNITIDSKSGISNIGYNLPDYVNGNVILTNITQTSGSTNNSFKEIIGDNLVIDGCKNINLSILPALANNNWILSNVKIINSELANGTLQGFKNLSVTTLDIENTNITTLNDAPTKFEKLSGQQSERSEQLKGKTTGARIKNNSSLTSFGNWNPTGLNFLQIVDNAKLNKEDVTKFETAIETTNPDIQIVHDSIVDKGDKYLVNVSLTPADFKKRITNGEVNKPIEMGEGEHNIDCSGLDLISFKNFPKKINGNLIAKDLKKVKTLEFFPEEIAKDVDLSGTDLNQNAFDSIPNKTPKTVTIKGHLYLKDIKNLKTLEKQTGEIVINTDIFKVDLYKVKGIEVSKEPPFKKEGEGNKTVLKATGTPVTPESLAAYIDKKTKTIIYPIEGEVNGDFDCHGMSLVSFENFPKTIKGDLIAYKNNFDSFIDNKTNTLLFPTNITGSADLSNNNSLKPEAFEVFSKENSKFKDDSIIIGNELILDNTGVSASDSFTLPKAFKVKSISGVNNNQGEAATEKIIRNSDGTYTCVESVGYEDLIVHVDIDKKEFKVTFKEAKKDFDISGLPITIFKGCPKKVGGSFNRREGKWLTGEWKPQNASTVSITDNNLKDAPDEVGGSFIVVGCKSIKSLEGAPNKCKNFSANDTSIKNLKGGPADVEGFYYVRDCKDLDSLEGLPNKVGDLFSIRGCLKLNGIKKSQNVKLLKDKLTKKDYGRIEWPDAGSLKAGVKSALKGVWDKIKPFSIDDVKDDDKNDQKKQ